VRLFYCVKCTAKVKAHDKIQTLICDCGNRLVDDCVVQPTAREITKKIVHRPHIGMYDTTDKFEYARQKYEKV
jgi:hypothetical protein